MERLLGGEGGKLERDLLGFNNRKFGVYCRFWF